MHTDRFKLTIARRRAAWLHIIASASLVGMMTQGRLVKPTTVFFAMRYANVAPMGAL